MQKAKGRKRLCIIYASEDKTVANALVRLLRDDWNVWFAEEHLQGDWRTKVKLELEHADAVIPLLSRNTQNKQIVVDEWEFAVRHDKPVFPFLIEECEVPLGMGGVNRTSSHGWNGDLNDDGYLSLRAKLIGHFEQASLLAQRPSDVTVNGKHLALPSFVFSISSFETQLDLIDGVELLAQLCAPACLISAYDAYHHVGKNRRAKFWTAVDAIRASSCMLFLDSGNYEASRKQDYRSKRNPKGWSRGVFYEAVLEVDPDIVFTYDQLAPSGSLDEIVENVIKAYEQDMLHLGYGNDRLCPIVHLPTKSTNIAADASFLIGEVAKEIRPSFVAIPERELGDGLFSRIATVRQIREKLNESGTYQPLHLLGTGNPTTIAALAANGGDCFDGLEWCRTAANYDSNNLLHFQHFDVLKTVFAGRIKNTDVRKIVDAASIPFVLRACSYNFDYFCEWIRTVQRLTRAGEIEFLLSSIPHIGSGLALALEGRNAS